MSTKHWEWFGIGLILFGALMQETVVAFLGLGFLVGIEVGKRALR